MDRLAKLTKAEALSMLEAPEPLSNTLEEARQRLFDYERGPAGAPPPNPRCVNVEPMTGARLLLLFKNGEVRLLHMGAYLDRGIFTRLRDEVCFAEAFVDLLGGVEWPCGPALSRDTLYLESEPVPEGSTADEGANL